MPADHGVPGHPHGPARVCHAGANGAPRELLLRVAELRRGSGQPFAGIEPVLGGSWDRRLTLMGPRTIAIGGAWAAFGSYAHSC